MFQDKPLHTAADNVAGEFLKTTLPFGELDEGSLRMLVRGCLVGFFPRHSTILRNGREVPYLYVIQKGAVKIFRSNDKSTTTLSDYRGEGAYFGALSLLRGAKSDFTVEALEDTFCFLVAKESFLDVVRDNPLFAENYFGGLSYELVCKAYSELRCQKLGVKADRSFFLFGSCVGESTRGPARTISAGQSIHSAAAQMAELNIGSLLVTDSAEQVIGIVTDKDLRNKVIARRLDYDQPVHSIMSSPVVTISGRAQCFDAVLQMTAEKVHHLAVVEDGQIVGVVASHDLLVVQGSSPLELLREVSSRRTIQGLYALAGKVAGVVRGLVEEGAKADNITRMIAVINDHIIERLLTLLEAELGPRPVGFAWIVMGSEGRREQTFKTDQDNGIIYENPGEDHEFANLASRYFKEFGEEAVKHLLACGYPTCAGGMMASQAKWRKPRWAWTGYFNKWLSTSDPEVLLNAKVVFDFRPVHGDKALAEGLREHAIIEASRNTAFIGRLARDCTTIPPPLSLFRSFVVEKDGEHKNRLDLKMRGLVPIVDFARMMALKHGIRETNTLRVCGSWARPVKSPDRWSQRSSTRTSSLCI